MGLWAGIASVASDAEAIAAIDAILKHEDVKKLCGLPLTLRGKKTEKWPRRFKTLRVFSKKPLAFVDFEDERLSSEAAHQLAHDAGKNPAPVDEQTAILLLESYLQRQRHARSAWSTCNRRGRERFCVGVCLYTMVRRLALRWNILDRPTAAPERKIYSQPTPLLVGLAIFAAFFVVVFGIVLLIPDLLESLPMKALTGVFLGSVVLMIGGVIDDIRPQTPGRQIYWPLLAAFTAVAGGIGVSFISNPFGGVLWLDRVHWGPITLWADLFTVLWLMGMMYTTKLLDGLDGLVSGVTAIGGLIVAIVSLRPEVDQPTTALLALVLSASCLGFLRWNWNPARIFLGEGGSLLTGFLLGSLAIISGGKIATALLIIGLPILDVVWVMMRRAIIEHRSPFRSPDRKHLHFRLLDVGLSPRQTVLLLYFITAVFGSATLFVHGMTKLMVLLLLVILMFCSRISFSSKRHAQK